MERGNNGNIHWDPSPPGPSDLYKSAYIIEDKASSSLQSNKNMAMTYNDTGEQQSLLNDDILSNHLKDLETAEILLQIKENKVSTDECNKLMQMRKQLIDQSTASRLQV